jgi:GNAT superfamily N-acetyltransferase
MPSSDSANARPVLALRALIDADRAAWEPLWQGYQRFYQVALADQVTEMTWRRFLDPAEPMFVIGAFDGPRLVGIVHYIFHRSSWLIGPTCYLQDLFTSDDVRGRGIGRSLIEAVYAQASKAGAGRVYWLTHESNQPGRLLYDKLADRPGFIQYRKNLQ